MPAKPMRETSHRVLLNLFLCSGILWLFLLWRGAASGTTQWFASATLLLAAATTIAGITRNLPFENTMMAACFVAVIGGVSWVITSKLGVPPGGASYGDSLGPRILPVLPWSLPFLWVVILLNSRDVARLILHPWPGLPARGWWVLGLASLLSTLLDLTLQPFLKTVRVVWMEMPLTLIPTHWFSFQHSVAWLGLSLLILAITTPWLISKKPGPPPVPDIYPLIGWIALELLVSAACALRHLGDAASVGILSAAVTGGFGVNALLRQRTEAGEAERKQ